MVLLIMNTLAILGRLRDKKVTANQAKRLNMLDT